MESIRLTLRHPVMPQSKKKIQPQSMAKDSRPVVIFVLGGPGAGKGTQCTRIKHHFGFNHISAGDCLREERKRAGSETGALIEEYIRDGKIVPIEITCGVLRDKMKLLGWEDGVFLIDGFPRNEENLTGWYENCGEDVRTEFVLNFACDDNTLTRRLLSRGAAGSGRIDDNPDSVRKRLTTFHHETESVLEHFSAQNRCVTIHADRPVEVVWQDCKRLIEYWLERHELPLVDDVLADAEAKTPTKIH